MPENDRPEVPRISDWNRHEICNKLEWEGGFDFLVNGGLGSDFPQVEDPHFHKLREAFVKAANELDAYVRYSQWLQERPWVDDPDSDDEENDDE